MAKFVKKSVDVAKGRSGASVPEDKQFAKDRPALWEYLTLQKHDDGKKRETMTITLFVDGDSWKAVLNDRDNHRTAFVTADTFLGLLDASEGALAEDTADWRQYDPGKTKFRR